MSRHRLLPVLAALALVIGACGGDGDGDRRDTRTPAAQTTPLVQVPRPMEPRRTLGEPEGRLRLVAFPGYVEDGSTDRGVDWVSDFEQRTGCSVQADYADTSDELVRMIRSGRYDGASVSGDATLRLIAGGNVEPINTSLLRHYRDVVPGLKGLPHNVAGEDTFGVPQGRGANVLMWNERAVDPAPASWEVVWDERSPYRGKVIAYQSPIYIADAALYLKATRPELEIASPYALDDEQLAAAIELLEGQRKILAGYWADYTEAERAFNSRDAVVGVSWQAIANLVNRGDRVKVATTLPKEGATGWSDSWMLAANARHPNCMYLWMDHVLSPEVNARIAEWFGQAPSNPRACEVTEDPEHCRVHHATDQGYWDRVAYWTTPVTSCGDERGAICNDYDDWAAAWRGVVAKRPGR
ncbi:MAG TPA: extracellular solute-binding protein [Solirubrobacteraceae bacterium]|nr:extracellular solute-binding protein [Solirubrobacteraceae bacterium]